MTELAIMSDSVNPLPASSRAQKWPRPVNRPNSAPLKKFGLYTGALAARSIIGLLLFLPYAARVRTMGWLMSRVVAFPTGLTTRIRKTLRWSGPICPKQRLNGCVARCLITQAAA